MNEWWTIQSTALIFGIVGAACGLLGGLFGTVAGLLVPRGRGKPIVYGAFVSILAIALAGVVLGIAALLVGQPQHVWMWPLLTGGILLASILPSGLMIPAWYRQAERRRLAAAEFRRSS
jgi:MFS family permease